MQLTQSGQNKMVDILQTTFQIYLLDISYFDSNFIEISRGLIDKSSLIQVMAWCRTGTKPLP